MAGLSSPLGNSFHKLQIDPPHPLTWLILIRGFPISVAPNQSYSLNTRFLYLFQMLLDSANATQEGQEFLDLLSSDVTRKTLFAPLNSGFGDNTVRNVEWALKCHAKFTALNNVSSYLQKILKYLQIGD